MPITAAEITHVKQEFMGLYGFPHIIRCIDERHIKIQSPDDGNEKLYRNRKGYFSYNVQVVYDPYLKIRSIDTRCDSSMFNASNLRRQIENDYHNFILLCDSAYPCKTYLMTCILHPASDAETRYNNAQTKAPIVLKDVSVYGNDAFLF